MLNIGEAKGERKSLRQNLKKVKQCSLYCLYSCLLFVDFQFDYNKTFFLTLCCVIINVINIHNFIDFSEKASKVCFEKLKI